MTICIAGMHESKERDVIVAVFDRRLTTLGGAHSSERNAWKMRGMGGKWAALISGHVSEMTAIADAVKMGTAKLPRGKWREYSRSCANFYRDERKRLIESQILIDYDINSYREYVSLRKNYRELFDSIGDKVREFDQNLSLLMCGFDSADKPHIFSITGAGHIEYCDLIGHGEVGSGSFAATVSLDRSSYDKWKPLEDCIYWVLAAKFAAESADGVGPETAMLVFTPNSPPGAGEFFLSEEIEELRNKWNEMSRIPDGATAIITNGLKEFNWLNG